MAFDSAADSATLVQRNRNDQRTAGGLMGKLSDVLLRAKWRGAERWESDGGARGHGRLYAVLRGREGWQFSFQYKNAKGERRFYPIGPYDAEGNRGLSLTAARDRAAELSRLYRDGVQNLHEHYEAIAAAEERTRRQAEETAQREQQEAEQGSLRQLLNAYIANQERASKQSAADARRIFELHVFKAAPELASRRASELQDREDDFVTLLERVVIEKGHGRTAAKLRAYLRAAFASAIKAKLDPTAGGALRAFGIQRNPIANIPALAQFNRARDRNLSAEELGAFLKRLETGDVKKDATLLCLMLGGQRPNQLLRARVTDVDLSGATVTLNDSKGKRRTPRRHVVPLTKKSSAILARLIAGREAERAAAKARGEEAAPLAEAPVFSTDGRTALRGETISVFVSGISEAMVTAKEAREPFQLRDLRRTCETMLAKLNVTSDVRAELLSHGLGGVQRVHYDRHDYDMEKRAALEKWQRHLDKLAAGKTAEVTSIKTKKEREGGRAA
jgi:integrase